MRDLLDADEALLPFAQAADLGPAAFARELLRFALLCAAGLLGGADAADEIAKGGTIERKSLGIIT